MSHTKPSADTGSEKEKEKVRRLVEAAGLVGAANNTKWNVLLDEMRTREGWRPSYRYKYIGGSPSGWDVEWWHHLPFPFMGVVWFDIGLHQIVPKGRLTEPTTVDHEEWILNILTRARLTYEVSETFVRVFGYLPKDYEGFGD
jgi:hypothetical protein